MVDFTSVEDWVNYTDMVAVVTVTGESPETLPPVVADTGFGSQGRTLTLRVDDVLWAREGFQTPAEFDLFVSGWEYRDGKKFAARDAGGPRPEVGRSYVGAFWLRADTGEWGVWTAKSIFQIEQNRILPFPADAGTPAEARLAVEGKSTENLRESLGLLRASPRALELGRLDPIMRYQRMKSEVPVGGPDISVPGQAPADVVTPATVPHD